MKTRSTVTMQTSRIIARIMSAIIVGFFLLMFIGEAMGSNKRGTSEPMSLEVYSGLTLFAIGLLGLALAWKWELIGGIISLIAFIMVFIVTPAALLWLMLIFPANAILFIVVAYKSKVLSQKA